MKLSLAQLKTNQRETYSLHFNYISFTSSHYTRMRLASWKIESGKIVQILAEAVCLHLFFPTYVLVFNHLFYFTSSMAVKPLEHKVWKN